jgi:hypothetical protein
MTRKEAKDILIENMGWAGVNKDNEADFWDAIDNAPDEILTIVAKNQLRMKHEQNNPKCTKVEMASADTNAAREEGRGSLQDRRNQAEEAKEG